MINMRVTSRDDLLTEFKTRFKEGLFGKSENYNKKVIDAIWISKKCCANDGVFLLNFDDWQFHPDFEVFLDKYDAWIEPTEDLQGFFVHIKIKDDHGKKPKKDLKKSLSFRLSLDHLKNAI
jgi:hypothetical protein